MYSICIGPITAIFDGIGIGQTYVCHTVRSDCIATLVSLACTVYTTEILSGKTFAAANC